MFKSAATKIAHNSTIPALAVGNRDLRPLQDLITAEKSVLVSLQRLSTDLTKASEALKAWGQGEGDDLGDVLTASTTILSHFSAALTTWASLHHTVRDNMKSVRTREEALDDLRRRRKRVGASAESAEKKLNKMSPEHKNLGAQTDILNKLREEMRAMDGDILREEAALGDYKRKCTKNWMTLKFGGLVECCEKGNIVGDIGKGIIQEIPDIATTPGFPRPPYTGRGRVNDYVEEAQRAVDQVRFSAAPSECRYREPQAPTTEEHNHTGPSLEQTQSHVTAHQIPAPHLDFTPNAGGHSTRPPRRQSTSTNDFGGRGSLNEDPPHSQFSSLPSRGRDPAPVTDEFDPFSLSALGNGGVGEEPSLMASITDALSKSHRGMSIDQTTSISHASLDTVPKYEPTTGSEGHGYFGGTGHKRTTRRSTSPPVLPPGAAPAAIRAWDDGMSQGEDGAHSDRPASSSERASQQRIPSSEMDGEEEEGLPYDRDDTSYEDETRGRHNRRSGVNSLEASSEGGHEHESPEQMATDTDSSVIHSTLSVGSETVFTHNPERSKSDVTLHSRAASQRIPRVPPPTMDADSMNMYKPPPSAQTDEHARNTAAAREISRELETLSSTSPPSSNQPVPPTHVVQQPPQGHAPSAMLARPTVSPVQPPQHSRSLSQSPYRSTPPSPLAPPNAPFANRSVSPARPSTASTEKLPAPYGDGRPFPSPIVTARGSPLHLPTSSSRSTQLDTPESSVPGQRSPLYRTPPEYPRPPPPFSSPLMAKSTSSLGNVSGATEHLARSLLLRSGDSNRRGHRVILGVGIRQVLQIRNNTPMRRLSVVNPDPRPVSDDEGDFDYIAAYGGPTAEREATERGHRHSPSSSVGGGVSGSGGGGYAAGKYSSEV
ncbi:Eisosome component PIL1-domain-containing protein [Pisolithus thermaeus]|nr:Eisosome component PIL1-domain-containing protein [Pisolithus thermaeus]